MDRMRRIAGMGKAKPPSVVQINKDETIVFFRKLYKREKDRVGMSTSWNQCTLSSLTLSKTSVGKRDFSSSLLMRSMTMIGLKTPPATPLFTSLEMEAHSSQMVFQKELSIPRPVKPSASRHSGKPAAAKKSSPTNTSSKRCVVKGDPAYSREKNQPHPIDKKSIFTAQTYSRQKATIAAATAADTASAGKKHSDRCYASQGSSMAVAQGVTNPEASYKVPKNLLTTGSIFARHAPLMAKARSKDHAFGAAIGEGNGRRRRESCPLPAAARGIKELQLDGRQNVSPGKGKAATGSGHASRCHGHAGDSEATLMKGMRGADRKKERRPKFAGQPNK